MISVCVAVLPVMSIALDQDDRAELVVLVRGRVSSGIGLVGADGGAGSGARARAPPERAATSAT